MHKTKVTEVAIDYSKFSIYGTKSCFENLDTYTKFLGISNKLYGLAERTIELSEKSRHEVKAASETERLAKNAIIDKLKNGIAANFNNKYAALKTIHESDPDLELCCDPEKIVTLIEKHKNANNGAREAHIPLVEAINQLLSGEALSFAKKPDKSLANLMLRFLPTNGKAIFLPRSTAADYNLKPVDAIVCQFISRG